MMIAKDVDHQYLDLPSGAHKSIYSDHLDIVNNGWIPLRSLEDQNPSFFISGHFQKVYFAFYFYS